MPKRTWTQYQWILISILVTLTISHVKSQESQSLQTEEEQHNNDNGGEVDEPELISETPDSLTPIALNETNVNSTCLNDTKPVQRTVAHCIFPDMLSSDVQLQTEITDTENDISDTEQTTAKSQGSTPALEWLGERSDMKAELEIETSTSSPEKIPVLRLVNMTELVQDILWSNASVKSRVTPANCSIILFYASWCPFSAKASPHFNALPRAFPALRVAAIDVSQHTSVNSYFGILSVPTVVLYHNGKSIAKFNDSTFSLHKFAEFIQAHTDLQYDENINVTSQDFAGPIPSTVTKQIDFYLVLAWTFIIACFSYYVTKSTLWRRAVDLVRTTWREAEDHVHQD